jgi:hypothetical protein
MTAIKTKTKTIVRETANDAVDSISKVTITAMASVSGLIGLWAVACVVGAIATNGPAALVSGFVSALIG